MAILENAQRKLKLSLKDYDLSQEWNSCVLINSLRKRVCAMLPRGLYDPQDLEHQVLFRLTTFSPENIDEEIIQEVIQEQYLIICKRLSSISPEDL